MPEHPCTVFFEEIEWKALWCYYTKNTEPPEKPPALETVIRMVGTSAVIWGVREMACMVRSASSSYTTILSLLPRSAFGSIPDFL